MLLRLDNGPRTFDFRPGKQGWGHALHANTFRIAKPRRVKCGWFKKPVEIERVSIMVHCQGPRLGDTVIYEAKSGTIRTCVIVEIDPAIGVDDMYTLTLEEAPAA
uniref:Uncharacterized protein n=1 Tax=Caulobacter phage BL57 TaxID=3348355 RepID=A0AB74UGY0_9VIRU